MTYSPDEQALRHYFRPNPLLVGCFYLMAVMCVPMAVLNFVEQNILEGCIPLLVAWIPIRYMPASIKRRRLNTCIRRLEELGLVAQAAYHLTLTDRQQRFGSDPACILTPEFAFVPLKGFVLALKDITALNYYYSEDDDGVCQTLYFTAGHISGQLVSEPWASASDSMRAAKYIMELYPGIAFTANDSREKKS